MPFAAVKIRLCPRLHQQEHRQRFKGCHYSTLFGTYWSTPGGLSPTVVFPSSRDTEKFERVLWRATVMVKCGELDIGSETKGTGGVQPDKGSTEPDRDFPALKWWLWRRWKHLHKDDPWHDKKKQPQHPHAPFCPSDCQGASLQQSPKITKQNPYVCRKFLML